jgi:D-xylose 1-dehydrogenase (NADP+, D-xylono-1,5-lactone-forming)
MSASSPRWAVLGTANIAAHAFLPAMRAAGHVAAVVGSRDPARAAAWAADHDVGRAASYPDAIGADVDAVYLALPNDQHVEWAARAVQAGRAVLCEKPLGLAADEVSALLSAAGDALLWEAFVFPFHPQTALLRQLCASGGPIGGLREVVSEFHFTVRSPQNIRWQSEYGGGALLDVGCYPVRLARLLFGAEPVGASARAFWTAQGVDADLAAVADFPDQRRLIFSVGMRRSPSTFTRLVGTEAELRVTNPFHPTERDRVELWRDGSCEQTWANEPPRAFQYAIEHIGAVLAGAEAPRHLAAADALGNAVALDLIRAAAAAHRERS